MNFLSYHKQCTLVSKECTKTANEADQKHHCTRCRNQTTWYAKKWCYKYFRHKAKLVDAQENSYTHSNATKNLQTKNLTFSSSDIFYAIHVLMLYTATTTTNKIYIAY